MTEGDEGGTSGGSPLGVGIDVVCVRRFRRALERQPLLTGRLFSREEQAYAARFANPAPRLAARFAAKEAAVKALGVSLFAVRFSDLEVGRRPGGAPVLEVRGRALTLARRRGVSRFLLSLTHTDEAAQAVVLALGSPGPDLSPFGSSGRPDATFSGNTAPGDEPG